MSTGVVMIEGEDYPIPGRRQNTLGVCRGNADLHMPPFAVDSPYAQGNGDVSDAIITMRGDIHGLGGFAEFHFSAFTSDEADFATALLHHVWKTMPLADLQKVTECDSTWRDKPDAVWMLENLIDRIQNIPGATHRIRRERDGKVTDLS